LLLSFKKEGFFFSFSGYHMRFAPSFVWLIHGVSDP